MNQDFVDLLRALVAAEVRFLIVGAYALGKAAQLNCRHPQEEWFDDVARILSNSRRYGRGGISLLWHPTAFGGGQLPREIDRVFHRLVEHRYEWVDTWTSCIDLIRSVYHRYVNVDLLPQEYGSELFAAETYPSLTKPSVCEKAVTPAARN